MYLTKKLALHKVTIVTGILTLYGLCHYTAVRQRVFMTPLEKPMSPMTCYQCTVSSRPDNIQTTHFTLTTTHTEYKVPNRKYQTNTSILLDKWKPKTVDGSMNSSGYKSSYIRPPTSKRKRLNALPFEKAAYDIMAMVSSQCTFSATKTLFQVANHLTSQSSMRA